MDMFKLLLIRCAVFCVSVCGVSISASPAYAGSFRCNSYVIDVGMHKLELSQRCGAPASASSRIERRTTRVKQRALPGVYPQNLPNQGVEVEREVETTIEEWIYNFGPNQFMQRVVIEDGRIKEISDLGYGR